MSKRSLWLVAYDVRCPRRLAVVLDLVKAWSTGGQKSVHECWLTPTEFRSLHARLCGAIALGEDNLMFVQPEPKAGVRVLGVGVAPRDQRYFWIG